MTVGDNVGIEVRHDPDLVSVLFSLHVLWWAGLISLFSHLVACVHRKERMLPVLSPPSNMPEGPPTDVQITLCLDTRELYGNRRSGNKVITFRNANLDSSSHISMMPIALTGVAKKPSQRAWM